MPEDLIRYGLIPEFVGRVPVVVTLDGLDENALLRILQEPKNALTKQYHKLFELDGVELDFEDEALRVMARKSMERKTGARSFCLLCQERGRLITIWSISSGAFSIFMIWAASSFPIFPPLAQ